MEFTVEEINLMCIYDIGNRTQLIAYINDSLPDVYEPELMEIMKTVIDKLEHITDGEYAEIGFFPANEYDEQEVSAIG